MRILRAPALMGGWYRPQRRILRIAIWHHCASLGVHWQLFAYKATRWLRGGGWGGFCAITLNSKVKATQSLLENSKAS